MQIFLPSAVAEVQRWGFFVRFAARIPFRHPTGTRSPRELYTVLNCTFLWHHFQEAQRTYQPLLRDLFQTTQLSGNPQPRHKAQLSFILREE